MQNREKRVTLFYHEKSTVVMTFELFCHIRLIKVNRLASMGWLVGNFSQWYYHQEQYIPLILSVRAIQEFFQ